MTNTPFKLRSGNSPMFKTMGSSLVEVGDSPLQQCTGGSCPDFTRGMKPKWKRKLQTWWRKQKHKIKMRRQKRKIKKGKKKDYFDAGAVVKNPRYL